MPSPPACTGLLQVNKNCDRDICFNPWGKACPAEECHGVKAFSHPTGFLAMQTADATDKETEHQVAFWSDIIYNIW